jgi:hypothetical protein
MGVAISIFFGGIITVLTAVGVEYLRRPQLKLALEDPPLDVDMRRNLRIKLRNKPLPVGARWMQRAAAIQCRGDITFHHLNDGQDIFGRSMVVRWATSPEPIANQILDPQGAVQFYIRDFARSTTDSRIDVYPDEEELLDVAVRFGSETECYGWNNDSYLYNWRNPNWRLPRGRYLVKVVINSSGQKCSGVFRLINDVDSRTDFRLIPASPDDRERLL